jgi:hypothetical protein
MTWNLKKALKLIRKLQPKIHKTGYHLGLCGGVLNKGKSSKDLDLVLVANDQKKPNLKLALMVFEGYIQKDWQSFGYITKVELYKKKQRIDLLIPNKIYHKS